MCASSWHSTPNRLEIGGWLETNTFLQARRFYGMTSANTPNRNARDFQENPFATQWNGNYDTDTIQYHVTDTLKLGQLTLTGLHFGIADGVLRKLGDGPRFEPLG